MATPEWVDQIIEEEADEKPGSGSPPESQDSRDESVALDDKSGARDDQSEALPSEDRARDSDAQPAEAGEGESDADGKAQQLPKGLRDEIARLRETRRELEAKLREKDDRIARYDTLESRLAELQAKVSTPKKEEEQAPDFSYDPTANLDYRTKRVEGQIEQYRKEQTQREAAQADYSERQQRIHEGINKVREHEARFREAHADYDAAVDHARDHLRKAIVTQNQIWGRFASEDQIANHIATLELQTAFQALDNGLNPAEVVYKLAQQQYGYTPGQAPPAQSNGVDEETKRLEEGLKASRGGSTGAGKRTAKEPAGEDGDNLPELEAALEELTRHFH